jgi:gliding motility-associated-like protein
MTLKSTDATSNMLTWTPYSGWENGVGFYEIYRYSQGETMPTQVATTSENTYVDYLEENLSSSDRTFYFVRANESSQGIDNKIQTANSTYGYILHETKIFIPNAITPLEQDNNIFKPQCNFIQQGSYRMSIFNRYGTLIFFTDDLNQGWDGRYKGEFCKQGVYIYVIEFVNSLGEKQTRKGTVALIE